MDVTSTWQLRSACIDTPIDWWYPEHTSGPDGVPIEARDLCDRCTVRTSCLDHALRHERHGVWAGTSERGRDRLRKALKIRLVERDTEEFTRPAAPSPEVFDDETGDAA